MITIIDSHMIPLDNRILYFPVVEGKFLHIDVETYNDLLRYYDKIHIGETEEEKYANAIKEMGVKTPEDLEQDMIYNMYMESQGEELAVFRVILLFGYFNNELPESIENIVATISAITELKLPYKFQFVAKQGIGALANVSSIAYSNFERRRAVYVQNLLDVDALLNPEEYLKNTNNKVANIIVVSGNNTYENLLLPPTDNSEAKEVKIEEKEKLTEIDISTLDFSQLDNMVESGEIDIIEKDPEEIEIQAVEELIIESANALETNLTTTEKVLGDEAVVSTKPVTLPKDNPYASLFKGAGV